MMRGNYRRGNLDDLDRAERTARDMYDEALAAGQSYEAAVAQQTLWLTNSIRRDHEQALRHVDRALRIIRSDPELSYLLFDHLDNRVFSLQNLDRLDESQETIREAAKVAASQQAPASLQAASAVQNFWLGHWDEALAEVREVTRDAPGHSIHGMRERGAIGMLLQGIAALIAGRRDDTATAADHIDNADAVVPATNSERESCDFLIVAQSLIAEQQGDLDKALNLLGPLMIPAYAPMMLRHQWLPDAARLALEADRRDLAELAGRITAQEAARERTRARAYTAAARCSALLTGEPGPALEAAAHYRAVGRVPELAAALEDAGVLLGGARRTEEGRAALDEAVEIYRSMSAWWDVHRAERRAAEAGIR
jgi:tetratricopeptide (TPR) repeat protein